MNIFRIQIIRNTEPPLHLFVHVRAGDLEAACVAALDREFLGEYDGPEWPPLDEDDITYTIDALPADPT